MSRPTAGVRNRTVIITLPGSTKGAKESLESIIKLLPHVCQQASGADSRILHVGGVESLEREADFTIPKPHQHSCIHSHSDKLHYRTENSPPTKKIASRIFRTNNPDLDPTHRYRSSPYPMISVTEALEFIRTHSLSPRKINISVDSNITGYVVAEDVMATESVPAYRASIVDGYAVIAPRDGKSSKGIFVVNSVIKPTSNRSAEVQTGQIARVTTGAPLPVGATAVVMVEDTALLSTTGSIQKEEKEVEIFVEGVREGDNIREIGSDIQKGDIILRNGTEISRTGGELSLLASVGRAEVFVYQRPLVGVLSTGDELVEHNLLGDLRPGEVRDCNRTAIISAISSWGYNVLDLGIARDKPDRLEQMLRDALRKVDIVVTSGGVSMGEHDLLKPIIERSLGGTIHFGRVSMKPGKPTTFATIPAQAETGKWTQKLIFSLPGNPVSALVALHLFILPSLHHTSGMLSVGLPTVMVTLDHDFYLDPERPEFHRATVVAGRDGLLHASSTGEQRSSRAASLRSSNALLCLPMGNHTLIKGDKTDALLLSRIYSYVDDY